MVDTNIFVRLSNPSDRDYVTAESAVAKLSASGVTLCFTPQVAIEFRNVATRPTSLNGLGYSAGDADLQLNGFETLFSLIPETADIYAAWKSLVASAAVIGKQVHDARLAAVCQASGITQLLTFNVRHF